MDFAAALSRAAQDAWPALFGLPLLMVPFIVAEQIWPAERRPGWRDYGINLLIAASTIYLAMPAAVAAGLAAEALRPALPWQPFALSYDSIGAVAGAGPALRIAAMILIPLVLHDLWFYWAHRIEHRVGFLWEFHKLHHSDPVMNCSTFGRDHFLQAVWIAVFPAFTLGLLFDIGAAQAGEAGACSTLAVTLLSMFYHSAIRVRLPWLDRVIVTPQVHRIHHSADPAHHDRNFADVFPLMDILFGTYHRPARDAFNATGLGSAGDRHATIWQAQAGPVRKALRLALRRAD